MCDRRAKECHDCVSDELLNCAAMPLDLGADMPPIWILQGPHVLWIELFSFGRKTDQVCEQNADHLALFSSDHRLSERSTAGVAEPRLRTVLLPALRTPRHPTSLGTDRLDGQAGGVTPPRLRNTLYGGDAAAAAAHDLRERLVHKRIGAPPTRTAAASEVPWRPCAIRAA
jgi:hypothetical protein